MARFSPISIVPLFCLAACGTEPVGGEGTLALQWHVAPDGCERADVAEVEIRAIGPATAVERVNCEAGALTLPELPTGFYDVELKGFDRSGSITFESAPRELEVAQNATRNARFELEAIPANIDVRWSFENGRVCGANDAAWVEIGVFDDFDYQVGEAKFPCDAGEGALDGLRAGSYLVEAVVHQGDHVRWRGTTTIEIARADAMAVDVVLVAE